MLWHLSADAKTRCWETIPFIEEVNCVAIGIAITAVEILNLELRCCLSCKSAHVLWLSLLVLYASLALGTRRCQVLLVILPARVSGGTESFAIGSLGRWSGFCGGGFCRGSEVGIDICSRAIG
jgi:hypothetical protein